MDSSDAVLSLFLQRDILRRPRVTAVEHDPAFPEDRILLLHSNQQGDYKNMISNSCQCLTLLSQTNCQTRCGKPSRTIRCLCFSASSRFRTSTGMLVSVVDHWFDSVWLTGQACLDQVLQAVLPEELCDESPVSFSVVGHIGQSSGLDVRRLCT